MASYKGILYIYIAAWHTFPDQVDEEPSVLELLLSMPTGDCWDDAELWTVYEYCRGSRHLQLPPAYRAVLFQLETSSSAA